MLKFQKNLSANVTDFLFVVLFFGIGFLWLIFTPVGGSADDDFHLPSIWCANGNSETCQFINGNEVRIPEALGSTYLESGATGSPPCYVNWIGPSPSAQCLNTNSEEFVLTNRFNNNNYYPFLFYKVMGKLVSEDIALSVFKIKLLNLSIATILVLMLLRISNTKVKRSFVLTTMTTLSPIGYILISSTNPTSWTLLGIFFYGTFLINLVECRKLNKMYNYIGIIVSITLALGSRYDSLLFLFIITFAILIFYYKRLSLITKYIFLINSIVALLLAIVFASRKFGSFLGLNLNSSNAEQPNAILNLIVELPAFFATFVGGQKPIWVQPDGELGRNFGYGVAWLEFNFPSITGLFLTLIIFYLIVTFIRDTPKLKIFSLIFMVLSTIFLILIMRAKYSFLDGFYFQTRYLYPLFLVFCFLVFLDYGGLDQKLKNFDLKLTGIFILIGNIFAWQFYVSRYVTGLEYPYTSFKTEILWWPDIMPLGRIATFILYASFLTLNIILSIKIIKRELVKK
jgi:hypothetical protein